MHDNCIEHTRAFGDRPCEPQPLRDNVPPSPLALEPVVGVQGARLFPSVSWPGTQASLPSCPRPGTHTDCACAHKPLLRGLPSAPTCCSCEADCAAASWFSMSLLIDFATATCRSASRTSKHSLSNAAAERLRSAAAASTSETSLFARSEPSAFGGLAPSPSPL